MIHISYVLFPPPLFHPLVTMTFVLQDGQSPLYVASGCGHLQVVKALLDAGANVNQGEKVGILHDDFSVIAHFHVYIW